MFSKKDKKSIAILSIIGVCVIVVVIVNIQLQGGCGSYTVEMEEYSVNEWGIFKQKYASGEEVYSDGPRPGIVPMPVVVESVDCKPVIYFHGDGSMDLTVDINYSGIEKVTIPQAGISEDGIQWNIEVAGDIYDEKDEARIVTEEETVYEYLFYEGISWYPQNLIVNIGYHLDDFNITLQNIGSYDMEDMFIILELPGKDDKNLTIFHIPSLISEQIVQKNFYRNDTINPASIRDLINSSLINKGLKSNEAGDLLEYWIDGTEDENGISSDDTLLKETGEMKAKIVYFISEGEYNDHLPIKLSKEPVSMNRVGIIQISDIPIHLTNWFR